MVHAGNYIVGRSYAPYEPFDAVRTGSIYPHNGNSTSRREMEECSRHVHTTTEAISGEYYAESSVENGRDEPSGGGSVAGLGDLYHGNSEALVTSMGEPSEGGEVTSHEDAVSAVSSGTSPPTYNYTGIVPS